MSTVWVWLAQRGFPHNTTQDNPTPTLRNTTLHHTTLHRSLLFYTIPHVATPHCIQTLRYNLRKCNYQRTESGNTKILIKSMVLNLCAVSEFQVGSESKG